MADAMLAVNCHVLRCRTRGVPLSGARGSRGSHRVSRLQDQGVGQRRCMHQLRSSDRCACSRRPAGGSREEDLQQHARSCVPARVRGLRLHLQHRGGAGHTMASGGCVGRLGGFAVLRVQLDPWPSRLVSQPSDGGVLVFRKSTSRITVAVRWLPDGSVPARGLVRDGRRFCRDQSLCRSSSSAALVGPGLPEFRVRIVVEKHVGRNTEDLVQPVQRVHSYASAAR